MAERICPQCKTNPLAKSRRYCDTCRDARNGVGGTPPAAVARPAAQASRVAAPPASRVVVIPALQNVAPRAVDLNCGCTVESSTQWQEQDTNCKKHGATWVARVSR